MRQLKITIYWLLSLCWFNVAGAVSLGEIKVYSLLNQPFKAEIVVSKLAQVPSQELSVRLVSADKLKQINQARLLPNPNDMTLKIIPGETSDTAVIEITSKQPISEPYLHLAIDLTWSRHHLLREYFVLLELPDNKVEQNTQIAEASLTQQTINNLNNVTEQIDIFAWMEKRRWYTTLMAWLENKNNELDHYAFMEKTVANQSLPTSLKTERPSANTITQTLPAKQLAPVKTSNHSVNQSPNIPQTTESSGSALSLIIWLLLGISALLFLLIKTNAKKWLIKFPMGTKLTKYLTLLEGYVNKSHINTNLAKIKKKSVMPEVSASSDMGHKNISIDENVIKNKLNLALAYIDMEDYAEAQVVLREIMEQGNPAQQQTAKRLLEQIG